MMKDLPEVQVIDIDKELELIKEYNIKGVPTLVFLDDAGGIKAQRSGLMTADQIRGFLA